MDAWGGADVEGAGVLPVRVSEIKMAGEQVSGRVSLRVRSSCTVKAKAEIGVDI